MLFIIQRKIGNYSLKIEVIRFNSKDKSEYKSLY